MGDVLLAVEDLHVSAGGKEIVRGISLELRAGEKLAIMGPNGSGKSTFVHAVMGHPKTEITRGRVLLKGEDITKMPADQRARKGMFLAFQYPVEIPGVSVANFLRHALGARAGKEIPVKDFRKTLMAEFGALGVDKSFAGRDLNEGFSGGEKKRLEVLQLAMLKPAVALLDETDSGLDIDALKVVAEGVNRTCGADVGVLLVTHYQRLLDYIKPDRVGVLLGGRIVREGGPELALELEKKGYDWLTPAPAATAAGGS